MGYHTKDVRGDAQQGIRYMDSKPKDQKRIFKMICEGMKPLVREAGIPALFRKTTIKSGGLFGSKHPMLVISHPTKKYFRIGIYVNGNSVSFPLLGKSPENTKYNRKQQLEQNGHYFMAGLIKPDVLKLEEEGNWQGAILDCYSKLVSPPDA